MKDSAHIPRRMRRLTVLLVAFVMLFTLSSTAFAATVKVNSNGKAPSGLSVGTKVVTGGGTYTITGVNSDGSYKSVKSSNTTTSTYTGSYSNPSSSSSSRSGSSSSSSGSRSSSGSSGSSSSSTGYVKVNSDGKAPSGLPVGTKVVTAGGTYTITKVNSDGSYVSEKSSDTTTSTYSGRYDNVSSSNSSSGKGISVNLSAADQEKTTQNSINWFTANALREAALAAGDTEAAKKYQNQMDAYHAENDKIMSAAGATYDPASGSYSNPDGTKISTSTKYGNQVVVKYTTDSNGETVSRLFSKESLDYYTPEELVSAYNQIGKSTLDAWKNSGNDDWNNVTIFSQYFTGEKTEGGINQYIVLQTEAEMFVLQALTGKSEAEVGVIAKQIADYKSDFHDAEAQARALYEKGYTPETNAKLAELEEKKAAIAAAAEKFRNENGYTAVISGQGDSVVMDGGGMHAQPSTGSGSVSGVKSGTTSGTTTPAPEITCNVTVTQGAHGTISPDGTTKYPIYSSPSFTITPDEGYKVKRLIIDGKTETATPKKTFILIDGNHTLTAEFELAPVLEIKNVSTNSDTASNDGSLKSGYGFSAALSLRTNAIKPETIQVTATYNFGTKAATKKTVQLESVNGKWEFPKNSESSVKARKVYVPVEAKDGDYTITYVVTGIDYEGNKLTDQSTSVIVVKGSMYEDDFTGRGRH